MMLAKFFLLLAVVWTFEVNAAISSFLEEMIKMNPPMNIRISSGSFGEYTVSWDGNCTFQDNVYYQLDYKYLNPSDSKSYSYFVQEYQKKMDLELHRGLFTQVKLGYFGDTDDEISSNWTERTFDLPRDSFASVDNLTCIFYGNTYMNCTWDINENAPENEQYILSYRKEQTSDMYNCTNYRMSGARNTGCVGHKYDIDLSYEIIICISELNNKTKLPYCRKVKPYYFHKLNNPINVRINKSTDEVTWNLPEVNFGPSCYKYQLNITNWNDKEDQKVKNTSVAKYVISRDKTKRYSVQVRALVNDICLESTIWSDWSKPLIIEMD
ncbi:interleukin-5 receptor subunit alpha-like isoform X2 [Pristis pectinata]|uniref:interleukin-5 receptor subunit alpha-like isoform X2 n=1 Tax=Pristis pectinata TaxID=685728 RepID=UPI00223D4B71|nr:interleukin-5 receptor subunit alpha-like isoform X2 [Pristis pectinata]